MSASTWVPGLRQRTIFGSQLDLPWAEPRLTAQRRRWLRVLTAAQTMGVRLEEVWYDRTIGRRLETLDLAAELIVLLPGRSDTRWWQRLARASSVICLIHGRLAVGDHTGSAPFPSHALYFGEHPERFIEHFAGIGTFIRGASNMLRNTPQPLHNDGNATTLPRGVAVVLSSWRALSRPPRKLWVACVVCHYSTINEDKALRGWQESSLARPRRLYRCPDCAALDRPSALLVMPDLGGAEA